MSRSPFAKIAALIVGLALPLSIAAPASAAVTTQRDVEEQIANLDLEANELHDRLADVDTELLTELETKLDELRNHGLDNSDLAALAAGEDVAGVNSGLIDGLLSPSSTWSRSCSRPWD